MSVPVMVLPQILPFDTRLAGYGRNEGLHVLVPPRIRFEADYYYITMTLLVTNEVTLDALLEYYERGELVDFTYFAEAYKVVISDLILRKTRYGYELEVELSGYVQDVL